MNSILNRKIFRIIIFIITLTITGIILLINIKNVILYNYNIFHGLGARGISYTFELSNEHNQQDVYFEPINRLETLNNFWIYMKVKSLIFQYNDEFFKAHKIRRIVFCKRIVLDGSRKASVSSFKNYAILLDVKWLSELPIDILDKIFHHEVGHFLFSRLGNEQKVTWKNLNPPDFKYHFNQWSPYVNVRPGFTGPYSLLSMEEDICNVYALMVTNPKEVMEITDEILLSKVKYILKLKNVREVLVHMENPLCSLKQTSDVNPHVKLRPLPSSTFYGSSAESVFEV